jgi:hypothetical protein
MAVSSKPEHGSLGACSQPGEKHTNCSFACNAGYELRGGDISCRYNTWTAFGEPQHCVRTCFWALKHSSVSLMWWFPTEQCQPMSDEDERVPDDGYAGTCSIGGVEGDTCDFECGEGFVTHGSPLTCRAGAWTGSQTCVRECCSFLRVPCRCLLIIACVCASQALSCQVARLQPYRQFDQLGILPAADAASICLFSCLQSGLLS